MENPLPLANLPKPSRKRYLDQKIPSRRRPKMIVEDMPEDKEWVEYRERTDKFVVDNLPLTWKTGVAMNEQLFQNNAFSPVQPGDDAPMFKAQALVVQNTTATDLDSAKPFELNSKDLLDEGNQLILNFFWGDFCPYCAEFINRMHGKVGDAKKVKLVAISPHSVVKLGTLVKHFSNLNNLILVSDAEGEIMKSYGVYHELSKDYQHAMEVEKCVPESMCAMYGAKDGTIKVPLSSGFVVDSFGVCRFSEYFVNNHKKPSVNAIASVVGLIQDVMTLPDEEFDGGADVPAGTSIS